MISIFRMSAPESSKIVSKICRFQSLGWLKLGASWPVSGAFDAYLSSPGIFESNRVTMEIMWMPFGDPSIQDFVVSWTWSGRSNLQIILFSFAPTPLTKFHWLSYMTFENKNHANSHQDRKDSWAVLDHTIFHNPCWRRSCGPHLFSFNVTLGEMLLRSWRLERGPCHWKCRAPMGMHSCVKRLQIEAEWSLQMNSIRLLCFPGCDDWNCKAVERMRCRAFKQEQ